MAVEYSPFPWACDDNRAGHEGEVNVYDANGEIVIHGPDMEDADWRDICDTHLMAAAPELLNVCEGILECLDAGDTWPKASRKNTAEVLRAVIARAKGEHRATLTTSADEATQE